MAIPLSRRLDFSEIPQIDLGRFLDNAASPDHIATIATACTNVGFFYVKNHRVHRDRISTLRNEAQKFFERPADDKLQNQINSRMRGYLPLDYASYENEEREAKSHQEGYWIGYDRPVDPTRPLEGPNIWPEGHDDFKTAMLAYQMAVEPMTYALQRAFSQAFGLSADGFEKYFETPMTHLKLNHYPPQDNPETVKHIGVVPHSDSGAFTILWQDDGEGLEIQNKSGEWIGAPSIPDTFVINIGNIMQTWTNGMFSSTPHRVINRGGRDRYSIPVFVYPGHDAVIAPIGKTQGNEASIQRCGDYLRDTWRRTFPIANIQ